MALQIAIAAAAALLFMDAWNKTNKLRADYFRKQNQQQPEEMHKFPYSSLEHQMTSAGSYTQAHNIVDMDEDTTYIGSNGTMAPTGYIADRNDTQVLDGESVVVGSQGWKDWWSG